MLCLTQSMRLKHSILDYVTAVFLAYMFSLFLLFMDGEYYSSFGVLKCQFAIIIPIIYAVVFVIISIKFKIKPKFDVLTLLPLVCFTLYCCINCISALVSPYFPDTVIGRFNYNGMTITIVFTVMMYCISFSKFNLEKVLSIGAVGLFIEDIIIVLHLLGFNTLNLYGYSNYYGYNIITFTSETCIGTLGNIDCVANLLCMLCVLYVSYGLWRNGIKRWLFISTGVLQGAIIVAIGPMLGIVGILCGFSVLVFFCIWNKIKHKKTFLVSLVLLFVLTLLIVYFVEFDSGILSELHGVLHGNFSNRFGTGRLKIWRDYLLKCRYNLLLGHGPNTSGFYELGRFTRFDPRYGLRLSAKASDAHNVYLNILFDSGVIAVSAYIMTIAGSAINCIFKHKWHLLAAIVAWATSSFFCVTDITVQIYFIIILGIANGQEVQDEKIDSSDTFDGDAPFTTL